MCISPGSIKGSGTTVSYGRRDLLQDLELPRCGPWWALEEQSQELRATQPPSVQRRWEGRGRWSVALRHEERLTREARVGETLGRETRQNVRADSPRKAHRPGWRASWGEVAAGGWAGGRSSGCGRRAVGGLPGEGCAKMALGLSCGLCPVAGLVLGSRSLPLPSPLTFTRS